MTAELREALAGSIRLEDATWQPISTAPKDGTRILVTDGEAVGLSEWVDHYQSGFAAQKWFNVLLNKGVYSHNITHWMPLPTPPEAS